MRKYYSTAKPFLEWKHKIDGTLTDADTITCAIYDPKGKLVSASATETCTKSATGTYYYDGLTLSTSFLGGIYQAIVTFTDGTHITRDDTCVIEFEVVQVGA